MKTRTRLLAIPGLILFVLGPSFSQAQTYPARNAEAPGMKELGVDISNAGATAEDNQSFVKSLPADQQAKVKQACLVHLVEPVEDHAPVVVAFCRNLEGAT